MSTASELSNYYNTSPIPQAVSASAGNLLPGVVIQIPPYAPMPSNPKILTSGGWLYMANVKIRKADGWHFIPACRIRYRHSGVWR